MAPWDTMLQLGGELHICQHGVLSRSGVSFSRLLREAGTSAVRIFYIPPHRDRRGYVPQSLLERDQIALWHSKEGPDCFMALERGRLLYGTTKRGQIALWHHQAGEDCFMAPPKDNQESKETGCFMAPPIKAKPFDIKQYLRNQLQ